MAEQEFKHSKVNQEQKKEKRNTSLHRGEQIFLL